MDKSKREELEYTSLYTDERYAKKAFKTMIGASLEGEATVLPDFLDAKGNIHPNSVIYTQAYQNVENRLRKQGLSRKPMTAEVAIEANVIRMSFDSTVLNTLLDRTAGKVKDEISLSNGNFDEISYEDLVAMKAARKLREEQAKLSEGGESDVRSETETKALS